ncbi:MAG TPA: deoxyribonuclease V [Gammaproteobacteria bacterium]|nr:deoxyribonuclease V [Gammaproteobacteria bacterium]
MWPPERIGHEWDNLTSRDARQIQEELAQRVRIKDAFGKLRTVAGVDVGFEEQNTITRAAIAVLRFPELDLLEHVIARRETRFPYIPGYLSFREIPAVLDALRQLAHGPDMLLCDGQGIAHPRRFGIACHLGVLTDLPSIGVAKSRLCGEYEEPGPARGDASPLMVGKEQIGWVLRSRERVKPLFVSPGHRVSMASCRELVMQCVTRYRLPETTRWAHRFASG